MNERCLLIVPVFSFPPSGHIILDGNNLQGPIPTELGLLYLLGKDYASLALFLFLERETRP